MAKPCVLVLCTGNSCRSQMAEGYLRRLAGERFPVYSAGTRPAERVHPLAVKVMAEDGVDLTGNRPRDYRDLLGKVPVRSVIIVCDGAAKECPTVWPGAFERLEWPFEDPAVFEGDEQETLEKFRQVRDQIKARIVGWLQTPAASA